MADTLEISTQDRMGMAASLAKFFESNREYQKSPVPYSNRTNAKPLAFELYWMLQDDETIVGMFARLNAHRIKAAQISETLREFILSHRVPSCAA